MKTNGPNVPSVLLVALCALVCFGLGYLAPHNGEALAQSPAPTPSVGFDNVPGGVGGHGHALITAASTRLIAGTTVGAWPCMQHDTCQLDFEFRFEPPPRVPAPYTCPRLHNHCITFTGKDFLVDSRDQNGTHHPDSGPYTKANVAGIIQLVK
jgi:hypothetical protein